MKQYGEPGVQYVCRFAANYDDIFHLLDALFFCQGEVEEE